MSAQTSDDFAAAALKLAGLCTRALGWRPPEFWAATPAELAACLADPAAEIVAPPSRAQIAQMMKDHHDG